MKFTSAIAAFFSVAALLCAVSAAPVAGDNELARRTSPGGGSYTGYFDPAEDANVDNNELSRRTSPGGGNYAGYFDPAEDTTAEGLYRRTSPGGRSYTGYFGGFPADTP
ncbi:hypothetical protein DAEQUDRAFT_764585 [Daedalea quercina L-15889]|uniref:Uncharacterized protein n=1 Tax=Daedalea quercina L-15889 TaxID=1314783 RepID=A0A165R7I5_9APHY|nr:hypothetical protein DAEQUDRAFT_764585 [Daedalea quercina L-15889]